MFYHSTIRNYTASLLDTFNHIEVPRYSSDETVASHVRVPVHFKQQMQMFKYDDLHNKNRTPFGVLELIGLNSDSDRDTSRHIKRVVQCSSKTGKAHSSYNRRAYTFDYLLQFTTRTFQDMTVIIEQLSTAMRPDIELSIKPLTGYDMTENVHVQLGEWSLDFPDLNDDSVHLMHAQVELTVKGFLYPKVQEAGTIDNVSIQLDASAFRSNPDLSSKPVIPVHNHGRIHTDVQLQSKPVPIKSNKLTVQEPDIVLGTKLDPEDSTKIISSREEDGLIQITIKNVDED